MTKKLFSKAEDSIRDLLRYDSYRRFLKSTAFLWIESIAADDPRMSPGELKDQARV